jgi:disulfide bond formation protein DsbB
MVKIALAPILLFFIIGLVCYANWEGTVGLIFLILFSLIGIILGIFIAIYIHKKHGAVNFNSKIIATPDLDKKDKI